LTCSKQLSKPSCHGPKNPFHIFHCIYIIPNLKKFLWCKNSKLIHLSYLSYMTNHYQHARNDQANDIKLWSATKPYRYMKPFLTSETRENEKKHMIPRENFVLWDIKIPRMRWYHSFICTQAHMTNRYFSESRKLFFKPPKYNYWQTCWNGTPLCKHTMCS